MDHFELIPKKIDFDCLCHFFTYDPNFFQKMAISQRKVIMGKKFEIEVFVLRYVFYYAESILIKNDFFIFVSLRAIFAQILSLDF